MECSNCSLTLSRPYTLRCGHTDNRQTDIYCILVMSSLFILLQDTQLLSYVNHFYDYNTQLGTEMEEKQLVHSIQQLEEVSPEPLVKFLHITINNLCTLLVRPTINESSKCVSLSLSLPPSLPLSLFLSLSLILLCYCLFSQLRCKEQHFPHSLMSSKQSIASVYLLINTVAMSLSHLTCSMCLVLWKDLQTRLHLTYATPPFHDRVARSTKKTCHEEAQLLDAQWW